MSTNLFDKYDTPAPRYTSYPPVPNWQNNLSTQKWLEHLKESIHKSDAAWSLYMHLPFCESLCTFCACTNIITRDHTKEQRYIRAVQSEWELYLAKVPELKNKTVRQIHLGGGSPTFFSADNLKILLEPFFSKLTIDFSSFDGAIEVDPRRCTYEQLKTLKNFGFNRISLGVQDFDPEVQKNVNRIQPFEMVEKCVDNARELGFNSMNFDLIYGLPGQTEKSIYETAIKTIQLKPDRIALYSLAMVPWLRPAQNRFKKMEVKRGYEKRKLFEIAKEILVQEGYQSLGLDHFALPTDPLAIANRNGSMHRNFMGYTEYATNVILGLGMSAISETPNSFHQNQKTQDAYYKNIEDNNEIPTMKGHILSDEDKEIKSYILNLMTQHSTGFKKDLLKKENFFDMEAEGLLMFSGNNLILSEAGAPFVRHVCQRIDRYTDSYAGSQKFSLGV